MEVHPEWPGVTGQHPAGGLLPEESLAVLFQSMVVYTHMEFSQQGLLIQESTKGSYHEVPSVCGQQRALVKLAAIWVGLLGLCQ